MKPFKQSLLALFATVALLAPSVLRAERAPAENLGEAAPLEQVQVDLDAPAVPGQYIIKFKSTTAQKVRQQALQAHGGSIVNRIPALDSEVVEFPALMRANAEAKAELLKALKQNAAIELIEPNYIYEGTYSPNDPSIGSQWAWNKIQAYQAWDITRGNSDTIVAVVDSGVRRNHVDLDANALAGGYDYVQDDTSPDDVFGHGTHVAGTIAAETNNSTGGAGTCPNCKILSVRVLDGNNQGSMDDITNGIYYAADYAGVDVINLSLGGPSTTTMQQAVNYAWNKGIFLACASGNSNTSSYTNSYPAAYSNCFAIASTTSTDARSSFSNYGTWVELAAPGSSIYSTSVSGGYQNMDGTSMATPHVAGVAALLSSQGLTNSQIRDRLCSTADKISGTGTYWTCGRLNAYKAVNSTTETPTPTATSTPPTGNSAIVNGGFETGTTPWVETSNGGGTVVSTTRPRTGSYGAYFGGYNNAVEKIYQPITVPAGASLSYYYYVSTSESGSTAYDYLRVRVYSSSGALLGTLKTYSNASTKNTWVADTVSLSSYAGQSVRIQFEATTDGSLVSSFFVDDVKTQ